MRQVMETRKVGITAEATVTVCSTSKAAGATTVISGKCRTGGNAGGVLAKLMDEVDSDIECESGSEEDSAPAPAVVTQKELEEDAEDVKCLINRRLSLAGCEQKPEKVK